MLKSQRQNEILKILSEKEIVMLDNLARDLNVSLVTIRRDVGEMESRGDLKKVHGGIQMLRPDAMQTAYGERVQKKAAEKAAIGKLAMELIQENDIVFFDGSTTTLAMIDHIGDTVPFTAITNSTIAALALSSKQNVNVIPIGGELHKKTLVVIGHLACEMIQEFHSNIVFTSAHSLDIEEGLSEGVLAIIDTKRCMVNCADKVVALIDHTKFNAGGLCKSIPLEDIDIVITDNKAKKQDIEALRNKGKKVLIAEIE